MKQNKSDIEERFRKIYHKHVKRYNHRDTNQMYCMWSISDPPDDVYECDQIHDIENEFGIEFTEDEALDIYNMYFKDAVNFILEKSENIKV